MAGLALNSQVRRMDFACTIMNGMAFQALGAGFGLMRGARHIRMALNAGHKGMTSLSNLHGIDFQGNFFFVDGFDTGVFLMAFQTEGLGSKCAGVGLHIGKTVAIQAIPCFAFQNWRHHWAGFICLGVPNEKCQKRRQTDTQKQNPFDKPSHYSFPHVIPVFMMLAAIPQFTICIPKFQRLSNSPGCSCIIFSRVVLPLNMVFSTGNVSGRKWVVTM